MATNPGGTQPRYTHRPQAPAPVDTTGRVIKLLGKDHIGPDVIRTIQNNHQWFGHYHTAGNPGRHEIDATQELNYPAIVRAIAATGYQGFLGQEFIPTRDPATTLREAFEICSV